MIITGLEPGAKHPFGPSGGDHSTGLSLDPGTRFALSYYGVAISRSLTQLHSGLTDTSFN
jgi:hypothetical protein